MLLLCFTKSSTLLVFSDKGSLFNSRFFLVIFLCSLQSKSCEACVVRYSCLPEDFVVKMLEHIAHARFNLLVVILVLDS